MLFSVECSFWHSFNCPAGAGVAAKADAVSFPVGTSRGDSSGTLCVIACKVTGLMRLYSYRALKCLAASCHGAGGVQRGGVSGLGAVCLDRRLGSKQAHSRCQHVSLQTIPVDTPIIVLLSTYENVFVCT